MYTCAESTPADGRAAAARRVPPGASALLKGATPDEVYFAQRSACRKPRFEPRPGWPRASPCAKPIVLVKGQPGAKLDVAVEFVSRRRHLPRVSITRAA
jgi:hypothetical protein